MERCGWEWKAATRHLPPDDRRFLASALFRSATPTHPQDSSPFLASLPLSGATPILWRPSVCRETIAYFVSVWYTLLLISYGIGLEKLNP